MKKIFFITFIMCIICLFSSVSFATQINGMTEEEIIKMYEEIKKERDQLKKSRDAKFEIIRNNNATIIALKANALTAIETSSKKVDTLLTKIKNNEIVLTNSLIIELTNLLNNLQTSNETIKNENVELQKIVSLVKIRGYDSKVLTVLDSAIEKQNAIIISYKKIIATLEKL